MANITIYDSDSNKTYQVTVTLGSGYTSTDNTSTQEGQGFPECYLAISTNLPNPAGGLFPTSYIKTLTDVPDGYPTATSFDELVRFYIEYYQAATIYESSSSRSSSSSSSSDSSYSSLDESSSFSSSSSSSSDSSSMIS